MTDTQTPQPAAVPTEPAVPPQRQHAVSYAVVKALADALGDAVGVVKTEIEDNWNVGDRLAAVLPDGTKVGTVSLDDGHLKGRVDDMDAVLAWVREHYPHQVETVERKEYDRVHAVFLDGLKDRAAQGEAIPGMGVREVAPHAVMRFLPTGRAAVAGAWRRGDVGPGLVPSVVALPAGQDQAGGE